MICTVHLTPRCRRPVRGQVYLFRLLIDADGREFSLPSHHFRMDAAPGSRAVYATDRRAIPSANGVLMQLPVQPRTLFTTAIWRVSVPGEKNRDVRHVVQWLLPQQQNGLLTDDTWLWPSSPDMPTICPGDWPVMEPEPSMSGWVVRRGLSVVDTRNSDGLIIRRFQSFPLAVIPLPGTYPRIPDSIIPLT